MFYDLVVVVLVARAAHRFGAHLTARGAAQFGVVFTVIWIAWFNATLLHDLHGREDIRGRNTLLAQILLLVPLGAYVPAAGDRHGEAFAVTTALLFLLLAFLWWRVSRVDTPEFARPRSIYVVITLLLAGGLGASVPLSGGTRVAIWGGLTVLYLVSVGVVFRFVPAQFGQAVAITESLNERFGLLAIIVLGETVSGVVSGLTADATSAPRITVGLVCVLIGFGAWWTYFDFIGHRPPRDTRPAIFTWLIGHLPVTAAIAAMGATMPRLVRHATDSRTPNGAAWVLCVGAVVVLVATVALMASLQAWHSAARILHPLAIANVIAAAVAVCLALLRPAPLVLGILVVAAFSGPWTLAVLRKLSAEPPGGPRV